MHIVVDGVIFESQARGGISRLYAEILPRICEMSADIQMTLLTAAPLKQPLPSHSCIHHVTMPGLQRVVPTRWYPDLETSLRGMVLAKAKLKHGKDTIWHSTHYTRAQGWRGRSVCTVLDMIPELFPSLFGSLAARRSRSYKEKCVREADAIICISQSAADDVRRYYGLGAKKPVHVVHLACSSAFHQFSEGPVYDPPTERRFLLYVGTRYPYKNFRLFLDAYSLWTLNTEVDMVVVGPSWTPAEEELLRESGLTGRVQLLTQVGDDELCALYNLAGALVFPSQHEGFGLPLLEAMNCGCPIVASRIPSTVEVAGDCPIYFVAGEIESLGCALDQVIGEGRSSPRVQTGLSRAREFSWEKTARQTLDVYCQLAG